MERQVAIVIRARDDADRLERLLASLEASGTLAAARVVVVDDASRDDTAARLGRWADRVAVLHSPVARGTAAALNLGARAADAPLVVFLDVACVVARGWLDPLVAALADRRVGVAGARVVDEDGRVRHAGVAIAPGCTPIALHVGAPGDHPAVTRTRDLAVVSGACLAVRRDRLLDVGAFDEGFAAAHHDTDLCLRLAAQGFAARHCGEALVTATGPARSVPAADDADAARLRRRWREWTPDHARLLAEDGIERVTPPDVLWRGPLTDDSAAARVGRAAVVALTAAGYAPAVEEEPTGPAMPGLGPALDGEVLAALGRSPLNRGVARVFHHAVDPHRAVPPVVGAELVLVHPVQMPPPPCDHADLVVALDDLTDPVAVAEAALGPASAHPEGVGYFGPAAGPGSTAAAGRALAMAAAEGGRPVRMVVTDAADDADDAAAADALGGQDFRPGLWIAAGEPAGAPAAGWERPVFMAGGRVVGWCWTDGDGVPATWWDALRWVDEVWVPSAHTARVFAAAGVEADRLRVVPVAVDTDLFRPPATPPPDDVVTLLAVVPWTWIGGWDALVTAWAAEFAAGEPVRLRIVPRDRTTRDPQHDVRRLLASPAVDAADIAPVEVLPPLGDPDLAVAMREAHALVHAVRGEGRGREILCAMASGLPVVGTAAGAHAELIADYGISVPGRRGIPVTAAQAGDDRSLAGLLAVEPAQERLRSALRWAVDEHAALRRCAEPAVALVHELAGLEAVAEAVAGRLDGLLTRERERV